MTLEELLREGMRRLLDVGIDTAALDATVLLGHAAGLSRLELILQGAQDVDADVQEHYTDLIAKREAFQPVAYLVGEKEFWGLPFKVRPGVLVPRPDSETLVAAVLALLGDKNIEGTVADVGTGSGALLLSLLHEMPYLQGIGTDISPSALSIVADNAAALGLAARVQVRRGDACAPLTEQVHIIVSNPPYIEAGSMGYLPRDVRDYEPHEALDGGTDGMDIYNRLVPQAFEKLVPGGLLALEFGLQRPQLLALLEETGFTNIQTFKDLGGRERVVTGIKAFK